MSTETQTLAPRRIRAKTISAKRISKRALERGRAEYIDAKVPRPQRREECKQGANVMRPCPFVSCKHHLYLDVDQASGSIKLNFPQLDVWELRETCALDVAERGGATLEEVGAVINLVRDRVRQIETGALAKLKALSFIAASAEEGHAVFRATKLSARRPPSRFGKGVREPVPGEIIAAIRALCETCSLNKAATKLRISRSTLIRVLAGKGASAAVIRELRASPSLQVPMKRAA